MDVYCKNSTYCTFDVLGSTRGELSMAGGRDGTKRGPGLVAARRVRRGEWPGLDTAPNLKCIRRNIYSIAIPRPQPIHTVFNKTYSKLLMLSIYSEFSDGPTCCHPNYKQRGLLN